VMTVAEEMIREASHSHRGALQFGSSPPARAAVASRMENQSTQLMLPCSGWVPEIVGVLSHNR
ncbi:MAG: hypothetical protein ACPIOQ_70740, partial [Promethearchaeia archaeon]